jgi:hypothetical protein
VIALVSSRYRLGRREVAGICTEALGVAVSIGSVDELRQGDPATAPAA